MSRRGLFATSRGFQPFMALPDEQSIYESNLQLKDRRGRPLDVPDPDHEALSDFLERAGWEDSMLEGHSSQAHAQYFAELLSANPSIRRVAEIGFNAGHSADMFLSARVQPASQDSAIRAAAGAVAASAAEPADEDANDTSAVATSTGPSRHQVELVVSFDIMRHPYACYGKLFVDEKHPGRHVLLAGDSARCVPTATAALALQPFDLIFIDGAHTEAAVLADIESMRALAHERTLVVLDNVAPHRGCGRGVYSAWRLCLERGVLVHVRHVESEEYMDAWAEARYAFPEPRAPPREALPDFAQLERRVAGWELCRRMQCARTPEELAGFEQELRGLAAKGEEVDPWAWQLLEQVREGLALEEYMSGQAGGGSADAGAEEAEEGTTGSGAGNGGRKRRRRR